MSAALVTTPHSRPHRYVRDGLIANIATHLDRVEQDRARQAWLDFVEDTAYVARVITPEWMRIHRVISPLTEREWWEGRISLMGYFAVCSTRDWMDWHRVTGSLAARHAPHVSGALTFFVNNTGVREDGCYCER